MSPLQGQRDHSESQKTELLALVPGPGACQALTQSGGKRTSECISMKHLWTRPLKGQRFKEKALLGGSLQGAAV